MQEKDESSHFSVVFYFASTDVKHHTGSWCVGYDAA